ncbi:hypothetical protein VP01_1329g1 [Puccinia sorghi]|uniref:RNase H type-1 domain-containing protein n=1 Tax=Puccinia sorghi TaxID=27349 RepID=A0A0L6VMN8_9BASI|nr:hypothetical protein VP01_1329g1 [Puccinia sorghi]
MTQDHRPFVKAFILTDNKGVIQQLSDPKIEKSLQYLFLEILEALSSLPRDIDLNIVWCPEHQGIIGNKAVDLLAGEATDRNETPDRTRPKQKDLTSKNCRPNSIMI